MVTYSKKNLLKRVRNIDKMRRRHVGDQEEDYNDEDKKDDDEMLARDDHVKGGS